MGLMKTARASGASHRASRRRLYPGQDSLQRVVIFGEHGMGTFVPDMYQSSISILSLQCLLVAGNFFKQKQMNPMSTSTATTSQVLRTPLTRSTWWSISRALATPIAVGPERTDRTNCIDRATSYMIGRLVEILIQCFPMFVPLCFLLDR
jgi:hypothetical protein